MKKIAFMFVALLMAGSTIMAQDVRRSNLTPAERADKMTDKLASEHSLNDTQKQQLHNLNRETYERWGDRYDLPGEDYRVDRSNLSEEQLKQHRENMRTEREAYNEKVKGILTPSQYSDYMDKQNQREEKREDRAKERRLERDNR